MFNVRETCVGVARLQCDGTALEQTNITKFHTLTGTLTIYFLTFHFNAFKKKKTLGT